MEPAVVRHAPDRRMTDVTDQPTPDEVFSVLARELRTPLSTIEGYIELLNKGDVGELLPEQREYLDVVSRNVQRLVTVVGDWTEVCRLEANRQDVERVDVDLEEVVDRAVAEVRPGIRVKSQRLQIQLPDEPIMVLGDARALLRIVQNLLSNACKYTPPHGSIRILAEFEGDNSVRLDVIDTGIGLREEDQPRLFRKFFRSTLTEAEPGTGLGLALCRMLAERMDGSIGMTSALGKGSTFTVRLPRAGVVSSAPVVLPTPEAVGAGAASCATASPVGSCSEP
jgi:two-component system, OmpR family, phosphate regulon sensor histidine kinase PhoR